jgi:site-specific DNA-cytosine methylase
MPKDFEDSIIEPARKKAERRWSNYELRKRLKEQAQKVEAQLDNENELAIADTISNEKPGGRRSVIRAQTKFAKDIKVMMEGHAAKTLALYAISRRAQRYRLLREKLRRLEAREAQRNQEQPMSNANYAYAYDVDEALANWDRIKIEQVEEQRRRAIGKEKESLPYSEPLAISMIGPT